MITTVRYGKRRYFKIVYTDTSRADYLTEDLEEFQRIAFPKKDREKDHGIKEARVYLPVDLLKVQTSSTHNESNQK